MAIAALTNLTANTTARAADVIGNDNVIRDHYNANAVEKSGAQSIAGVKTFSDIPVFSNGATVTAGGVTISSGGLTATGNSTITGTLTALTGLTSSGTASLATVTVSGSLTLTGGSAVGKRVDDGNSGTADTIDWATGNIHKSTLTGNSTFTYSNPATGALYVHEVLQDGTGSRTVVWDAAVVWDNGTSPTLTTTINKKDVFGFLYNGVKYIGFTIAMNVTDTT